MFRFFLAGLILSLLADPEGGMAQGDPVFTAFADAEEVLLNSYFDITFTLRNGEGQDFQPPSFDDFTIVSGPSRSLSTTIINGQVAKEMGFTYSLKPRRVGEFRIGAASISVGGKTLSTGPVVIKVIAGKTGDGKNAEQFFIRAEPDVREAYIGQQISLDYKLYTTVDIESYNVLEESDYPGFFAEDLKRLDGRVFREIVNGRQYTTKILKRVALFPQQAGLLTVDPMQLQLGIVADEQRRPSSFFFNRQIKRLLARTEPVQISVRPLPAQAPASFCGAVGAFAMTSELTRTDFTTDDALSLKITVEGDGDIKRVQAPVVSFPDAFEVYDPKTLEEAIFETEGRLRSRKTFEYLALPREAGDFELLSAFSYFDPDSSRYVASAEKRYPIRVKQGSRAARPPVETYDTPPEAGSDIRFIKLDTSLRKGSRTFFGSTAFWVLTFAPFLLLGGVLALHRYQAGREQLDPALLRQKKARKVALLRLSQADQFRRSGLSRSFYDETSKAMLGYVGDKLQIPRSAMSKDAVHDKLRLLGVPDDLAGRFLAVIQACELALFAGKEKPEAIDQTYENAISVLTEVEQLIKVA